MEHSAIRVAIHYELEGERPVHLLLFPLQRIDFRGLMQYVLFKSLLQVVKGRVVGWGKLERTASVEV